VVPVGVASTEGATRASGCQQLSSVAVNAVRQLSQPAEPPFARSPAAAVAAAGGGCTLKIMVPQLPKESRLGLMLKGTIIVRLNNPMVAQLGFAVGQRVLTVNGVPISNTEELSLAIANQCTVGPAVFEVWCPAQQEEVAAHVRDPSPLRRDSGAPTLLARDASPVRAERAPARLVRDASPLRAELGARPLRRSCSPEAGRRGMAHGSVAASLATPEGPRVAPGQRVVNLTAATATPQLPCSMLGDSGEGAPPQIALAALPPRAGSPLRGRQRFPSLEEPLYPRPVPAASSKAAAPGYPADVLGTRVRRVAEEPFQPQQMSLASSAAALPVHRLRRAVEVQPPSTPPPLPNMQPGMPVKGTGVDTLAPTTPVMNVAAMLAQLEEECEGMHLARIEAIRQQMEVLGTMRQTLTGRTLATSKQEGAARPESDVLVGTAISAVLSDTSARPADASRLTSGAWEATLSEAQRQVALMAEEAHRDGWLPELAQRQVAIMAQQAAMMDEPT